jgi:hypothetical protein
MNGVTVWDGRAGRNGPARSPLVRRFVLVLVVVVVLESGHAE